MEGSLLEINYPRDLLVISLAVLCLRRRCTNVNSLVVTSFRIGLDYSLITVDLYVVVLAIFDCFVFQFVLFWIQTIKSNHQDKNSLIQYFKQKITDSDEENHIERDEPTFPWQ